MRGDVTYSRLRIANGGIVSGKLEHVALEPATEQDAPRSRERQGGEGARQPAKVHYIE